MKKLKEIAKNNDKALKQIEKIDKKLCDILFLLFEVEDKMDYENKDLSKAIDLLKNL